MFSLVIHGHFYQPPREDPFLDEVETEASAAPYHDWNQRIERECYRAVVAARVAAKSGRIGHVVNTLEWVSFNFGPTLLEWLEREARSTYDAILAADRASAARLAGFGNAIAQPYHHTILPLASRRDKITEVRWGMADFRRRFGRDPLGMWLPETAVDAETLDVLANEGIAFTILAPHQVTKPSASGRPLRYRTASGKSIALFAYHGPLSHGIAFGGLLHDAHGWVERMEEFGSEIRDPRSEIRGPRSEVGGQRSEQALESVPTDSGNTIGSESLPTHADPMAGTATHSGTSRTPHESVEGSDGERLLSAATDGETYGHHHRFGEMALARAIEEMLARGHSVENFASFLDRNPAVEEADLVEPTSWSCAHGVERWRSNCGCRLDSGRYPSQAWRTPLREGLTKLAEEIHAIYAREGSAFFRDPWAARDGYGAVVGAAPDELARYTVAHATIESPDDLARARELLEMERDALRMFTSCAWFFDDIGGIEPRQILRYAARAIALAGPTGSELEKRLLATLELARSNDPLVGTGRDVYVTHARPALDSSVRLAAAAVAAVRAGASPPARHWADVAITHHTVTITEPRTGRRHQFTASVLQESSVDVVTEVRGDTGTAFTLHLADLPERTRLAIRSRLRRAILPRCLTPDELELLVAGDATLAGLIRVALLRTVERLANERDGDVLTLANDLLDLFGQFEAKIPFDAQTAFARIWDAAPTERRNELAALRVRLGFEPA